MDASVLLLAGEGARSNQLGSVQTATNPSPPQPRARGENIAQMRPRPCRALKRLDERRMIVGLDLEGAGPSVADVDDARILSRPCTTRRLRVGRRLNAPGRLYEQCSLHITLENQLGNCGLASTSSF